MRAVTGTGWPVCRIYRKKPNAREFWLILASGIIPEDEGFIGGLGVECNAVFGKTKLVRTHFRYEILNLHNILQADQSYANALVMAQSRRFSNWNWSRK
jgi:hypothetical protein